MKIIEKLLIIFFVLISNLSQHSSKYLSVIGTCSGFPIVDIVLRSGSHDVGGGVGEGGICGM